ncbi:MAG: sulfotransferase domain-containing protein [Candidatus Loosdrechtia sp.]|uniref:sulfotransferase domain-containing protein n=1 Tax=Candidatus Loosdrechtia sp. TaxID=3101272 RepID=UPI003A6F44CB|nr:MAG: sulfotransferase domain-containing protein [Candidatus Jettenia sp. AMX2]
MAKIQLTDEILPKLKYINKKGLKEGTYYFPDFLIIGPQRTGTTWLSNNLVINPQIFIPFQKEFFFFNALIKKRKEDMYTSDRLEWYSNKFSPRISNVILTYLKYNIKNFMTFKRLEVGNMNLIKCFHSRVMGESTASYAAMEECLINEIVVLNPDIKIIMLIRNPIDRAWSHAKKDLLKWQRKSFPEIKFSDFENFYNDEYILRCGKYTEIIEMWNKYIKQENFFIGVFDDIIKNPKDLLMRIFKFLEVRCNEKVIARFSETVINSTPEKEMPEIHRDYLKKLFENEISKLNKMFNLDW